MDKALRSSLGWIACGILIITFIYAYIYIKNGSDRVEDKYKSWFEANGIIKDTVDQIASPFSWEVEYADRNGEIHNVTIEIDSSSSKSLKTGDKIKLLYNPENANDARCRDMVLKKQ